MRVMVAGMPRMLQDIIERSISTEPDMQLVPAVPYRRFDPDEPDVLVVGTPRIDQAQQEGERWLARWPRARILVIETSGRTSMMYELKPHVTPLGELSPWQLVEAIRAAGGPRVE